RLLRGHEPGDPVFPGGRVHPPAPQVQAGSGRRAPGPPRAPAAGPGAGPDAQPRPVAGGSRRDGAGVTFGGTGAVAPGRLRAVRALTLLAIDPRLGGAVLVGPPGAGKGTAARAFRSLVGVERPFIGASAADG